MVFFETPNGGAVFNTGSIAWAGSLSHNGYANNLSTITRNVLRRFRDPSPAELFCAVRGSREPGVTETGDHGRLSGLAPSSRSKSERSALMSRWRRGSSPTEVVAKSPRR